MPYRTQTPSGSPIYSPSSAVSTSSQRIKVVCSGVLATPYRRLCKLASSRNCTWVTVASCWWRSPRAVTSGCRELTDTPRRPNATVGNFNKNSRPARLFNRGNDMLVHDNVDFAGPFLGSMFLLLVDARSKWPEVVPMQSTTATKAVECLRTIFASHGLPKQLVPDKGLQFVSEQFQHFLQGNSIQHIRCGPYQPSTNGLVERLVLTFEHAMRPSETSLSLTERLQRFLLTYRTTPHTTTRESPNMLLQGRPLRTRLDLLRPDAARHVEAKQRTQACESKLLA